MGTAVLVNGSVTSAKVAAAALGTPHFANQGILSASIASGAIGSSHLGYSPGALLYSVNSPNIALASGTEHRFWEATILSGQTLTVRGAGVTPAGITSHMVEMYSLTTSSMIYLTTSSYILGAALANISSGRIIARLNNSALSGELATMGWMAFTLA